MDKVGAGRRGEQEEATPPACPPCASQHCHSAYLKFLFDVTTHMRLYGVSVAVTRRDAAHRAARGLASTLLRAGALGGAGVLTGFFFFLPLASGSDFRREGAAGGGLAARRPRVAPVPVLIRQR